MARFHAHVYFEPDQLDVAARLREALGERFPVALGRIYPYPIGPHTRGMFQVLFTRAQFTDLVTWLLANREGLDVLVHADTGDDLVDHTRHAMWLGNSLPLKLEVLRPAP